jgi:flagellar hook-associated protein 2
VNVTSAIVAASDTPMSFQGAQISGGTLSGVSSLSDPLTGSFDLNLGSGSSVLDIPLGTSTTSADGTGTTTVSTLSDLENYINDSNFGVTASIVTSGTGSNTTYSLSVVSNSSESLAVTANVTDSSVSANPLTFTTSQTSGGTFSTVAAAGDALTGSVSVQVGSGQAQTFSPPFTSDTTENTLAGLASAINAANMGVTATVVTNSDGTTQSLSLVSGTSGTAGTLAVTSTLLDTTNQATATLGYTNSSDINSLTGLGISVNDDGTITFDATSMDSVMNSDFSSVVGFFQNVDSWGQTFSNILTNAGTSSTTGILSLASTSNSDIESTLNADISKENSLISAQQTSLTAELNSANEIMQQLPSQLDGVNELYSAITGYNENSGG